MTGEYLSARYIGDDPDEALNGPDAVLAGMADYWMTHGREGRWPAGGYAHFTVQAWPKGTPPEDAETLHFSAVFPHKLFGTLTVGCLRPVSMCVRPLTEAEYRAALPGRMQEIADQLSDGLPEGFRLEWGSPQ